MHRAKPRWAMSNAFTQPLVAVYINQVVGSLASFGFYYAEINSLAQLSIGV